MAARVQRDLRTYRDGGKDGSQGTDSNFKKTLGEYGKHKRFGRKEKGINVLYRVVGFAGSGKRSLRGESSRGSEDSSQQEGIQFLYQVASLANRQGAQPRDRDKTLVCRGEGLRGRKEKAVKYSGKGRIFSVGGYLVGQRKIVRRENVADHLE